MRDFDAVCGEIDRRSREMRKQKKRRQRMLMTCVPLVLCVGIWSVLPRQTKKSDPVTDVPVKLFASGGGEVSTLVTQMTDFQYSLEMSAEVSEFLLALQTDQTVNLEEAGEITPESANKTNTLNSSSLMDVPNCAWELTDADGTLRYRLQGNVLEDVQEGSWYLLTEQQLEQLHALLNG